MAAPIRIGIIGTGGMAKAHAGEYKKIRGVVLSACLDVIPGRAQEFATANGFAHAATDLKDLFAHVDAVAIVTPDRFHSEPTIAALKAGKHVLCEKPLTVTLKEARAVAAAASTAARKGVIHMINFSYRRSAAMQKAIEIRRAGSLGSLRHVHSYYLQSWLGTSTWGDWNTDSMLWRLQTAKGSGGVLGDLGCHILDLTTAVSGEVEAVRCNLATFPKLLKGREVTTYQGAQLDANDTAIIELRYVGGATGIVHTSRWAAGHSNHLRCEVHGTKGAVRFDLDEDYDAINLYLGKDPKKTTWVKKQLKPTPNNYQRFITSIRTGKQDQPDILRGAEIQAYLDACLRSATSGRWEKILPWKSRSA